MGLIAFEQAVNERLQGKHHLQPIFSDCYDVARVLREYDDQLFVVFNSRRQKYEIHSLGNRGSTYACDVPNNRLDGRVIKEIQRGDLRIHGNKIFRMIDEHNERLEQAAMRLRRDDLKAVAGDLQSSFAKLAWEGI